LLEDVLEEQKDKKDKKKQSYFRQMCLENAHPETIDQYKWLIETKKNLAGDITTTRVGDTESPPSTQP
jgi:hypothetical protein